MPSPAWPASSSPVLPDLCGGRLIPAVPLAAPSSPSPDRTNGLVRSKATCYTGSKPSNVCGLEGGFNAEPNAYRLLRRWQLAQRLVIDGNWPNDPDDVGHARAGLWQAVLIEVGALGVFVAFWVAAALLLHQLAP